LFFVKYISVNLFFEKEKEKENSISPQISVQLVNKNHNIAITHNISTPINTNLL
jgi:hypothetical protein